MEAYKPTQKDLPRGQVFDGFFDEIFDRFICSLRFLLLFFLRPESAGFPKRLGTGCGPSVRYGSLYLRDQRDPCTLLGAS